MHSTGRKYVNRQFSKKKKIVTFPKLVLILVRKWELITVIMRVGVS